MEAQDLEVLKRALAWLRAGQRVVLATVVHTWGSAPRPPGSVMALREDGQVCGSVSGGCVEDHLIERITAGAALRVPELLQYGVSAEQAQRYGLPCGGTLELVLEPVLNPEWIATVLARCEQHQLVTRCLHMADGAVRLQETASAPGVQFDGQTLSNTFGPALRLLLIGAGELSRLVAGMAQALGYQVLVCDPRQEYSTGWPEHSGRLMAGMPDDVVRLLRPDLHTAILALTHDPKLDDMALLEALKSEAFYVGALGSRKNNQKRRARLALFDLDESQITRLHGPVGLPINSRTPAEIAISILAHMIAIRNGATC